MKNIPNLLSFFRILLIPFFIGQMNNDAYMNSAIILAVSGLTDFFDGFLARRFGWVTQLGKVLDPVADKLTQLTICVVFALKLKEYWFFFAIILIKDFLMLILGGGLVKKGVKIEGAKWWGKVSTFVFYVVMIVLLFVPDMAEWLKIAMLTLTTGLSVFSAVSYIPDYRRYKKMAKKGANTI